ncbi:hypothetical protein [Microbacterium enclense]|uniref:Uncharacterized protein n=1 Tax=Microbacterium enclense TaxID=993073 RepID=A0A1G6NUL2_9MICO|nr:hypothetical protein [Microbacterium enclense]KSU52881.1 hypothetical protein AS029_12800 [Microbacterium enclense]SDC70926.1 hypothetical protein SAMN05216418_2840 [Microbacterium enclense]
MGQRETQAALFAAIEEHTKTVLSSSLNSAPKAAALADLALAYRYASGGPQPGSVTVEKG